MGRIAVLDEATAGRIAAGEVVERPASVAKELVENALDAGASRIEVELGDGGRSLVRVSDDGEGMAPVDAALAFERHATSKLARAEDLESIGSYGFRGEALPAVGAVSRVRLLTCPKGAGEGTEIRYEGGRVVASGPGPAREGTVIWVRELFFNTPARREAMRSASTETARVSEVVGTLALANPGVAISLSVSGQTQSLWSTPGSGRLEEAAAGLYGAAFVRDMATVDWQGPVRVSGLTGLPAAARRDGKRQHLFCNGRPINPGILRGAIDEAYKTLLEVGRTPAFILNLSLPPSAVDVNIHPAKTYVRFRNHGETHRALLTALRAALGRADLFGPRLSGHLAAAGQDAAAGDPAAPGSAIPGRPARSWPTSGGPAPVDWRDLLGSGFWPGRGQQAWRRAGTGGASSSGVVPLSLDERLPDLEPLGQLGGAFIVAAGPDGLYLVDQHAAHERVVYERLLSRDTDPASAGDAQLLAVPAPLELGPGEAETLERHLGFLRRTGFELEAFGPRTVVMRAVPALLTDVSPTALIEGFLDRLAGEEDGGGRSEDPDGPGADRLRAARILAACRSALKGREILTTDEMRVLLSELGATAEPRTCPHGRPTVLRIGFEELWRIFGRT